MQIKKEINCHFISDPGHGWLVVNIDIINKLKIYDEISPWSFISKGKAFLEEDCDAGVFMKKAKELGCRINLGPEKQVGCFNRNLPKFNSEKYKKRLEEKCNHKIHF